MASAKTYKMGVVFGAKKAAGFDKTLGNINSSIKGIVKGAVGIAGAYVGISAITNYAKGSIQAAREQIEAETKLQAILKNTPGISSNAAENIGKLADAYERTGIVAGDVQIAGMQQLATYQLQEGSLTTLMEGMNDLIVQQKGLNATQNDAVSIGNMIGKVMVGQTSALSRAGIIFSKTQEQILKFGTEEQKAATLAEVLKQNVGGVNKAMAETDQGKIKQASEVWGSLQENIGRKILPMQAKFAGLALKMFPSIEKFALKAMDKVGIAIEWVTDKIDFIPPIIKKITGRFGEVKQRGINALNTIKDGLKKANKALEPYKSTFKAMYEAGKKAFSAIGHGVKKAKDYLLTTGLSKAFDFLATTIIPAVGKAAEKFFPQIGRVLSKAWNVVKPILGFLKGTFEVVFPAIGQLLGTWYTTVSDVIGHVLGAFEGIIDFVTGVFTGNWQLAWDGITGVFGNIFGGIVGIGKGVINGVISVINIGIRGINKLANIEAPDWIPLIGGKKFGFSIPEIPMLAKGGIVQKATVAMTGEAGKEAVIPLESRKSNRMLSNVFSNAIKNKNFGSRDKEVSITYHNTNVFYGDADKNEIKKATKESSKEFKRDMDNYFNGKARVQLA